MARMKRNMVKGLQNGSGDWVIDDDHLHGLATSFFRDLFTTFEDGDFDPVLSMVESRIMKDMNEMLLRLFMLRKYGMRLREWNLCMLRVWMVFLLCSTRNIGIS